MDEDRDEGARGEFIRIEVGGVNHAREIVNTATLNIETVPRDLQGRRERDIKLSRVY